MNKELERILKLLHNEHQFDPVVSPSHKQWWFDMAYRYVISYLHNYAGFEPQVVEFALW